MLYELNTNTLDEIRTLPKENIFRTRLSAIELENKLEEKKAKNEDELSNAKENATIKTALLINDYNVYKRKQPIQPPKNNDEFNKQVQLLKDNILNQHHSNYFYVIDMETGVGKTRETEKIIANDSSNNKYLFVRPDIKDCEESVKNINNLANDKIATNYDSRIYNNSQLKQEFLTHIKEYKVICIAHAKYKQLCKNEQERKKFIEDRNILIIDEYISPIDKVEFNLNIYNALYDIFSSLQLTNCNALLHCIKELLLACIDENTKKHTVLNLSHHKTNLKQYTECLLDNLNHIDAKIINKAIINNENSFIKKFININGLKDYINSLKNFVDNASIYLKDDGIITYNSDFHLFKLDNNIILNANGDLQPLYHLDTHNYQLAKLNKVFNRSNCILYNIPINTSGSAKEKHYTDFNKDMAELLFNSFECDCNCNNTLVVGNKDGKIQFGNCSLIDDDNFNYAYFGNLVGKNEYRELKNVAIIHTPNFKNEEYILLYLFIKSNDLTIGELSKLNTDTNRIGKGIQTNFFFKDNDLEEIKKRSIAEKIYQAIARINRNNKYKSKIYIFINDNKIFELVANQFNNCGTLIKDSFVDVFSKKQTAKQKENEQKIDAKTNEFIIFLELLLKEKSANNPLQLKINKNGDYYVRKKYYYEGSKYIKNKDDFKNTFNTNQRVLDYCRANNIDIKGQHITFR